MCPRYPYWDKNLKTMVYRKDGPWLVSVTPMLFNDRVLLTHESEVERGTCTSGYCYDKGPASGMAAMQWNPLEEPRPVGFKKIAFEGRTHV